MKGLINLKIYLPVLLFLMAIMIPGNVSRARELTDTSGSCGDKATYSFDTGTGVLKIYGSGAIANNAFSQVTNITRVEIKSSNITTIGKRAFDYCVNLESVDLYEVKKIDGFAFTNTGLTGVEIPSGVTEIGDQAFSYCSLTYLKIPSSVTGIAYEAFAPSALDLEQEYAIPDGAIIDDDGSLYICETGREIVVRLKRETGKCGGTLNYEINNETHTITITGSGSMFNYDYADPSPFEGRTDLKKLVLPDNIDIIGDYAFKGCSGLRGTLVIPNNVRTIGYSAFYDCKGLTGLTLSTKLQTISNSAFCGCTGLTGKLTLPNTLTNIGGTAFAQCQKLTGKLTIPDSVTSIGEGAFLNCTGLESLDLGNGTFTASRSVFSSCSGLTGTITIPGGLKYVPPGMFQNCTNLTGIVISDGVERISDSVFAGCSSIEGSLVIPQSVTNIGMSNFINMNLTYLSFPFSCSINSNNFKKAFDQHYKYCVNYGKVEDGTLTYSIPPITGSIIVQRNINDHDCIDIIPNNFDDTYTGSAIEPSVTVKDGSTLLTRDVDYTVTYSNNVNAGSSAKITVCGKGKFSGSVNIGFTIEKAEPNVSVTMNGWTYGQTASNPSVTDNSGNGTVTYNYTGTVNGGVSYNSSTKPTDAGSYKVTATISQTTNYNGATCEKSFTISRANISPSVNIANWTYGQTSANPVVTGNTGNGTVHYKYTGLVNGYDSSDKPTKAGGYKLTVTISQSNNYNNASCEKTFTISKADITPSVSMADFIYGKTASNPIVSGNIGDGLVSYTYKADGSDSYSIVKPITAGTHTVKATIGDTENYNGGECISTYTVGKADITPTISVADWIYGQTVSTPVKSGNVGNGTETIEYKLTSANDSTYGTTVPAIPGDYTVRYTVAESANYNGGVATNTFKIKKADITASVSMDDWTYKESANAPTTSCDIDDATEVVEYKLTSSDEWTTTVPTNAGDYTVRYTVSKDNYNTKTVTDTFKILKADIDPEVTMVDFTYSDTPSTPSVTGNTGNGNVTYTYKAEGGSSYETDVPINAGTHMVKAVIAETDNYKGATVTNTFKILKATKNITVSMDDFTYGQTATSPTVDGVGDHNGEVTYTYKAEGSDDFVSTKPVNVGTHTVKVTVSETDNFKSVSATSTYTVAKADINPTVSLEGWICGDTPKDPVVTGNSGNGEVSYLYKLATANNDAYAEEKPNAAGVYTVKAIIAESANYNGNEATSNFEIEPFVTIEKPSITINSTCKAVLAAGDIDNDSVLRVEYRLNGGEWTTYTEPVVLYKAYEIEARQIAKKSGKISEIEKVTGNEPVTEITAVYNGTDKYLNEAVEKSEITVTAHYPNSEDENVTNFSIDNYVVKREGNNTVTISALDKQTTITVKGKKHYVTIHGKLLFSDGSPVAGKEISLIQGTGSTLTTTTDDDGSYTFTNVEVGEYSITMESTVVRMAAAPLDLDAMAKANGDTLNDVNLTLDVNKTELEQLEDEELATTKEFLDDNNTLVEGASCNLPQKTVIVVDGKPVTFAGGAFTFDKAGIYVITLPDNTEYTVIAVNEEEMENVKEALSEIDTPVAKDTEYDLPKGTKITCKGETTVVENGKFTFDKSGIYDIVLPDGTSYQIVIIDEEEIEDGKEELSKVDRPVSKGDEMNLPAGTTITLDKETFTFDGGVFSFSRPGIYVITLPDGTTHQIIAIDEKAMAEVNERLSVLEKNATPNESVILPKGSKVEIDGKELDITDDDFTFDKEGTYIITLPDGTTHTIIVKEPVTEPAAKPETVTTGSSETLPDVSMISPEAARRPALTDEEKALLTKVKKIKPVVTKLASKKAGQIKVTMKGTKKRLAKQGIGYQIQVSGNKSFTKSKFYYSQDNKHGIRKLKSNKTYYIRVRLIKKDNKQIVGKWSKVRRVKVK